MPKKPGAYHRPKNMSEALSLLARPDSVVLAGGTKLLASESGLDADHVVDLQALDLDQLEQKQDAINVGATCTLAAFAAALAQNYPTEPASEFLQELIRREGPNTYRNAATVGGTIASRVPDSELLAALLVLDARLKFADSSETSLQAYLEADERLPGLITTIHIPWVDGQGVADRVARTPADYPIVSVVAWRPSDGAPRLAATGIASRPKRLQEVEAVAIVELNESSLAAAGTAARNTSRHPGDFRGDATYRAEMAAVLTRRVLEALS